MTSLARTVVRFAGALTLGGVAAVYDNREATAPQVDVVTSGVAVRQAPKPFGLQPGKRAFSVRVPRTARFEFGLRPNSRVDVLGSAQDVNSRSPAEILLRDVRVLAIAPIPQSRGDDGSVR